MLFFFFLKKDRLKNATYRVFLSDSDLCATLLLRFFLFQSQQLGFSHSGTYFFFYFLLLLSFISFFRQQLSFSGNKFFSSFCFPTTTLFFRQQTLFSPLFRELFCSVFCFLHYLHYFCRFNIQLIT